VHGCNGITEIKQSRKQEGEKQSSYWPMRSGSKSTENLQDLHKVQT
jgi:hypothetical protein